MGDDNHKGVEEFMKLDIIDKPKTFWYEDQFGNDVPFDTNAGMPDLDPGDNIRLTQHISSLEVRDTVWASHNPAAWPVRALKWMMRVMPDKWKARGPQVMGFSSTINGGYAIIKHLIENRDFTLNDAAVVAARMCERCYNICSWECEGHDLALEQRYLDTCNTWCKYCIDIDSDHHQRKKLWCCYRTLRLGGDVSKAYEDMSVYSDKDYMDKNNVVY